MATAPIAPSAPASAAPAPSYVYAYASGACTQALPGGYTVGEKVFFTGASQTWDDGDKVVHGQQGEVTGPATIETHKGKGVAVRFPGNNGSLECHLTEVRRPRAAPAAHPARLRSATVSTLHRDHASSWARTSRAIC